MKQKKQCKCNWSLLCTFKIFQIIIRFFWFDLDIEIKNQFQLRSKTPVKWTDGFFYCCWVLLFTHLYFVDPECRQLENMFWTLSIYRKIDTLNRMNHQLMNSGTCNSCLFSTDFRLIFNIPRILNRPAFYSIIHKLW